MSYPEEPQSTPPAPYTPPAQYSPPAQYVAPSAQYAPSQPGPVAPVPTNTAAILSLVSSIIGFFSLGLLSLVGVILGHVSLSQIKRTREGGRPLAVAGLVIGYIGIGFWLLLIIGFIVLLIFSGALAAGSAYSA